MDGLFVLGEGANYGVDINTGGIADSFANFVWEPAVVKVIVHLVIFICV
jgi:chaperonin GroEL (HSP60 family)